MLLDLSSAANGSDGVAPSGLALLELSMSVVTHRQRRQGQARATLFKTKRTCPTAPIDSDDYLLSGRLCIDLNQSIPKVHSEPSLSAGEEIASCHHFVSSCTRQQANLNGRDLHLEQPTVRRRSCAFGPY